MSNLDERSVDNKTVKELRNQLNLLNKSLAVQKVPSMSELLHTKKLLKQYRENTKIWNLFFDDVDDKNLTENEAVTLLQDYPQLPAVLTDIALQRIVRFDELRYDLAIKECMVQRGFVAQISDEEHEDYLYALTTLGLTLVEKFQKLQLPQLPYSVPNAVFSRNEKWNSSKLKKILMIRKYYELEHYDKRYIVFTIPGAKNIVFGCTDDLVHGSNYAIPWCLNDDVSGDFLIQLRNAFDVNEIKRLIIVFRNIKEYEKFFADDTETGVRKSELQTCVLEGGN